MGASGEARSRRKPTPKPQVTTCVTCLSRKKKCDGKQPTCNRCAAAGLVCGGPTSGLVFRGQSSSFFADKTAAQYRVQPGVRAMATLPMSPAWTSIDSLRADFVSHLAPVRGVHFKSLPSYPFMYFVPQRIGRAKALDNAVATVCLAFSSPANERQATRYIIALQDLQCALNERASARAPETLATVLMLQIAEWYNDFKMHAWVKHVGGAARLIQLAGPEAFRGELERSILESQIGEIIFSAIIKGEACFLDHPSWLAKMESDDEGQNETGSRLIPAEYHYYRCLIPFPRLLRDYLLWSKLSPADSKHLDEALCSKAVAFMQGILVWRLAHPEIANFHLHLKDEDRRGQPTSKYRTHYIPMACATATYLVLGAHIFFRLTSSLSVQSSQLSKIVVSAHDQLPRGIKGQHAVEESVAAAQCARDVFAFGWKSGIQGGLAFQEAQTVVWNMTVAPYLKSRTEDNLEPILEEVGSLWPMEMPTVRHWQENAG